MRWLILSARLLCKLILPVDFSMLFPLLNLICTLCHTNPFDRFVFKIKMPSDVRVKLINDLADIEYVSLCIFFFTYNFFFPMSSNLHLFHYIAIFI